MLCVVVVVVVVVGCGMTILCLFIKANVAQTQPAEQRQQLSLSRLREHREAALRTEKGVGEQEFQLICAQDVTQREAIRFVGWLLFFVHSFFLLFSIHSPSKFPSPVDRQLAGRA